MTVKFTIQCPFHFSPAAVIINITTTTRKGL